MRLNIRSKLILYTVVPVLVVFSPLVWLGGSHLRQHLSDEAQLLLVEHAHHQAARLSLVLSEVPALAESLGDLVLADPGQSQTLLYAHLIDGLRRTPIAREAGVALSDPPRGAVMRRGGRSGEPLTGSDQFGRAPGWEIATDLLRFNRPIYREGRRIGDTWVELAIADVYAEIERLRSPTVRLFIGREGEPLLPPPDVTPEARLLAATAPPAVPAGQVHQLRGDTPESSLWLTNAGLPNLPWRITAVTPMAVALEPAREEAAIFATGLLAALLAVVAIIGIVARQITRPLATLDAGVQRIAQGDFAVAPEVASDDEVGRLANAIRRMAGHIGQRERQLRDAQQVLEQRVAERTAALRQSNAQLTRQVEETLKTEEALRLANEQAQQANRAKSEFLSNMSHELRTPLHGVLGYAQILGREMAPGGRQRESLEAIERCGQHLLTLINDILDLTKIEAGQMELDIQPTDLPRLLEDVHMIVAQRAVTKGLALHLDLAGDLPQGVMTDPVKLRQILLNLLGNAVKFTTRGAVTLTAAVTPQDQLEFEVSDTGIGIPPDKIDAIFEAFEQAREGLATDGTGLGLAINQRLIDLLGGEALSVESTPGAGSRFRFRIPLQPLPASGLERLCEGGRDRTGRMRLAPDRSCSLLVIDELAESRNVVSWLLGLAGCEVEAFPTLADATQRLHEKAFDLVLCDMRLFEARAAKTVDALRGSAAFGTPRLVAVSTNVHPGVASSARQAGFDAFLAKPFDERQLLSLIGDLLDVRFEPRSCDEGPAEIESPTAWPAALAHDTARRIRDAIALGDVGSLFQLSEELTDNPVAPRADVDNIALMTRLFDFDGLRQFSDRLQGVPPAA